MKKKMTVRFTVRPIMHEEEVVHWHKYKRFLDGEDKTYYIHQSYKRMRWTDSWWKYECWTSKLNDSCINGCKWKSSPLGDQLFFSELMTEASNIVGSFNTGVRHLLHFHVIGQELTVTWRDWFIVLKLIKPRRYKVECWLYMLQWMLLLLERFSRNMIRYITL